MVRIGVGWCMAGAVLRLTSRKIVESQEINQPCFGETLTVFEFTSHILLHQLIKKNDLLFFPGLQGFGSCLSRVAGEHGGHTLILRKVQSHRSGRNAGFIRQDVKSHRSLSHECGVPPQCPVAAGRGKLGLTRPGFSVQRERILLNRGN
jgi:hypothetical protein